MFILQQSSIHGKRSMRKPLIHGYIEKAYSFIQNRRHLDKATSVYLSVEEIMTHNLNSVLFYKGQGQTSSKECENRNTNTIVSKHVEAV